MESTIPLWLIALALARVAPWGARLFAKLVLRRVETRTRVLVASARRDDKANVEANSNVAT
jgi:hypothetical protein